MINDINRESKNDLMSQTFIINCISTFSCRYHFGLWSQTYGSLAQLCRGNQSNISIFVTKIKIKVTTNMIFICCMKNSFQLNYKTKYIYRDKISLHDVKRETPYFNNSEQYQIA